MMLSHTQQLRLHLSTLHHTTAINVTTLQCVKHFNLILLLIYKLDATVEHPGQLLPFSQLLVLEWTPPPHSALQCAQGSHAVHNTGRGQGFFSLHSLETHGRS